MHDNSATLVYFSPTGTTRKVLKGIIEGLQDGTVHEIDLTPPSAEGYDRALKTEGLTLIGAPVYAGRIPDTAVQRLKRLKADKTPAVIVVVYGNRAYEDALLELSTIVRETGFIPIAAGAFIGSGVQPDSALAGQAGGRQRGANRGGRGRAGSGRGRTGLGCRRCGLDRSGWRRRRCRRRRWARPGCRPPPA